MKTLRNRIAASAVIAAFSALAFAGVAAAADSDASQHIAAPIGVKFKW